MIFFFCIVFFSFSFSVWIRLVVVVMIDVVFFFSFDAFFRTTFEHFCKRIFSVRNCNSSYCLNLGCSGCCCFVADFHGIC